MTELTNHEAGSWNVRSYLNGRRAGFLVLRGNLGEALDRDGNIQFDGTRPDCFFATEAEARAVIQRVVGGGGDE